ncbi:MAG: molybdopterin-dependent oxidoreductase [Ktedonobacteraceae bacterium]|nr:molybdopterin-dependent oxidoreductase [Ktedonobacteraceae bacterium]
MTSAKKTAHFWLLLCLLGLASLFWSACSDATTMPTSTPSAGASPTTASQPSVSLQVTGLVKRPGVMQLADLQAFPKTTVTTNAQTAQGSLGSHMYGGVLLYDLVQKAQIITDVTRKNDLLRKVIIVTGTDGYSVALSLGEIAPRFAGKKVLVAYEQDGKRLPQGDGFVRLIVPGDTFAGRYVAHIAKIEVKSAGPLLRLAPRVPSSAFYLVGLINTPGKYDLHTLQTLKTTEVSVQEQGQSGKPINMTYSGVLLNDLLASAGGAQLNTKAKNDFLRKGIVAIGSDGIAVSWWEGRLINVSRIPPFLLRPRCLVSRWQPPMVLHDWWSQEIRLWDVLSPT